MPRATPVPLAHPEVTGIQASPRSIGPPFSTGRTPRRSALASSVLAVAVAAGLLTATAAPASADPVAVTFVSTGDNHSCVLTSTGGVECWGSNSAAQLGDGTKQTRFAPVGVSGLSSGVIAVEAGGSHTCALTDAGGVKCWGNNSNGQLGDGTLKQRKTPVNVTGLGGGVTAIAAGGSHACALTAGGGVKCWGANASGQLGDGTVMQRKAPVNVSGLTSGVTAITAGASHTCALTSVGGVKCWGSNVSGQLGDGTNKVRKTPVAVHGLTSGVIAVAAGGAHTCALTSVGGVKCWGANMRGQLGDGTVIRHVTPADVSGLTSGVSAISASTSNTCAVASAGAVLCWGDNTNGQIGDGTITIRKVPTATFGLGAGATQVAGGASHTCGLFSGGGVKCWGSNVDGQLGDGTGSDHRLATDVTGLTGGMIDIRGGTAFTCGRTSSGGVKCWGDNSSAQLGDNTLTNRPSPIDPTGLLSGVASVAPGAGFTCAVVFGGAAKCWGNNAFGQLGDGTQTGHRTPASVSGLDSGVSVVVAGSYHACALNDAGGVQCWGRNNFAEVGDGTAGDPHTTPTDTAGLSSGVVQISAGAYHTCIVNDAGGVQCWGRGNFGQIGDGDSVRRLAPVDVTGMTSGVASVAAGGDHTCAIEDDGSSWCWGDNAFGQVGDGTTDNAAEPVAVTALPTEATAFALGINHTCALLDDGTVWCWGDNSLGQIGDGTNDQQMTPVQVVGLPAGIVRLAAGGEHTCAIDSTGSVWCWGANEHGQLGNGTTDPQAAPVEVPGLA